MKEPCMDSLITPLVGDSGSQRIAMILTHDEPGGARNLWEQIATGVSQRNWHTQLLSIYRKDAVSQTTWKPVTPVPLTLHRFIPAIWNLAAVLRKDKVAVTLAAQPAANVISAVAGLIAGARTRIVSHHTPLSTYGRVQRLLDLIVGCTPAVSRVICVSEGVRLSLNNYPQVYQRKVVVIHNALAPHVAKFIHTLHLKNSTNSRVGPLQIVAAGRLAEQKNYPVLIASMKDVAGAQLSILGDGPDRESLRALIEQIGVGDRVHLLGHQTHEAALQFMATCDVFAQPSLFEGHSVALLEAAALGLPLVVSDVPTQVEAVRSSSGKLCAAVVPVDNAKALGLVFNRLVSDQSYRSELKDAAYAIAAESGFDRLVTEYIAQFNQSASLPSDAAQV